MAVLRTKVSSVIVHSFTFEEAMLKMHGKKAQRLKYTQQSDTNKKKKP